MKQNPMREISLEKITLNMGAGESGPKLEKSKALLEKISQAKVIITTTHKRTTFGPAKGRPIGVMVTIRGEKAMELLMRLLQAVDNRIKPAQFDRSGNFSFGIAEYINVPGLKYDPEIGILGFDVSVTLRRPGYGISRRRIRPSRIGSSHRITAEDAQQWAISRLGIKVTDEVESRY